MIVHLDSTETTYYSYDKSKAETMKAQLLAFYVYLSIPKHTGRLMRAKNKKIHKAWHNPVNVAEQCLHDLWPQTRREKVIVVINLQ